MEFQEVEVGKMPASNRPVFVDADSLLYYSHPRNEDIESFSSIEALEFIKLNFMNFLRVMKEHCNSSGEFYFFFSCSLDNNYRQIFAKDYKANRAAAERPKFLPEFKRWILKEYSNTISCTNVEADDVVAYMQRQFENRDDCIVCSPDKDVLGQLSGTHFNYQKNSIVETKKESAERFLWLQMLAGDSTDGIRGLPKVGLKTANKILPATQDITFETIVGLYEARGLTRAEAVKTAYLVDINCIKKAIFDKENGTFTMVSLDLKY